MVHNSLVVMTVLLTASARASSQAPDSVRLKARGYLQIVEPVAPGVHLLRQAEPNFAGVIGNVTVIEQQDGLVLVDAGVSHGSGMRIVELVRSISPKPVKTVVITHWHGDHFLGLSAIVAAWPKVDIIAHKQAAADIDARLKQFPRSPSPAYEADRIKTLGEALTGVETKEYAEAATPEEKAGWRAAAIDNRQLRLADVAGTYLILPRRTFTDSLTLPDPAVPIELLFLGRANTSGDISAWLPRQRVLIAGDAVVAPVPLMFNVYPAEMLAVFQRMRGLPFQVLVPGHGTLQRDREYLDRLSELVREVQAQVGPLAREGVPLEQVGGKTDFSRQRERFAGSNAWLRYWFDRYTLTPLIESVYTEASGKPLGPPT
jgi:glyoxylase-like metal-dependent hydrolase (beta-lactamase superfamily II)